MEMLGVIPGQGGKPVDTQPGPAGLDLHATTMALDAGGCTRVHKFFDLRWKTCEFSSRPSTCSRTAEALPRPGVNRPLEPGYPLDPDVTSGFTVVA